MIKKIRVVMLGHKRIPSRNGGIEKVLTELAPELVRDDVEVTCFNRAREVMANGDHKAAGTIFDGVQLKDVFTLQGKGLAAVSASFFGALKAAFGPYDVVHFHAEGPSAMLWIPKLFGKRCVVTVHGVDWKRDKWQGGFGSWYIHFGERVLARYADAVIVLNHDTQRYFKEKYGRETFYIPNGVRAAQPVAAKEITAKYGLQPDNYLLSVSRLTAEKGVHTLIEAFKHTQTTKKLVIAGAASDTDDYVATLHRLAAGDARIIFTGFTAGRALAELYSNAYCYVLPSKIEGMPMTVLEAMAYGDAIIASDIPEIKDVAGDHAAYFMPEDVVGLQTQLQTYINDTAARDELRVGVKDAVDKYDWTRIAESTKSVYAQVLGEKKTDDTSASSGQ